MSERKKAKRFKKSSSEESRIKIVDFKTSFKYYKSRCPHPQLTHVIEPGTENFKKYFEDSQVVGVRKNSTMNPSYHFYLWTIFFQFLLKYPDKIWY